MAKVHEEVVVLKLSKLVKNDSSGVIATDEIIAAIEQVAQELVGDNIIVEVEKA
jgi:hypothetical protein